VVDVVVDEVLVVVEVEVEVGAAVVTGIVVVVEAGVDDVVLETATDDEVEPESGVAESSPPQPTAVNARRIKGTSRAVFTVGSLARFVAIT
jgi:hypothetical protein